MYRRMATAPVIETDLNDIKERISLGVLTAIAGRAGCEISEFNVDRNGVDATIRPIKGEPVYLDVQVKSSAVLEHIGGKVIYDIPVGNYHHLRKNVIGTPRILLLLDLHDQNARWWKFSKKSMSVRNHMYWADLRGAKDVAAKTKARIKICETQKFTPLVLTKMIENVHANLVKGEPGLVS